MIHPHPLAAVLRFSIAIGGDDLTAVSGDQGAQDRGVDCNLDEPDRPVGHPAIESPRMKRTRTIEGAIGLPGERQVVGLGPGHGILGLDHRDRVRCAVGDIRKPDIATGLEQGARAGEPAVGCRVRLRIRTTGTLVSKGYVLQKLLVMGAVPRLVELELGEEAPGPVPHTARSRPASSIAACRSCR